MNTFMWESRFTEQHLDVLRSLGVSMIPPGATNTPPDGSMPSGSHNAAIVRRTRLVFGVRLHSLLMGGVVALCVGAVKKRLACGDEGMGAMAAPDDIKREVARALIGFVDREYDNR